MPKSPITREDLLRALDTQTDVLKRELTDRFEHHEQRAAERHREMMLGIADVIENVNDHTTAELAKLRQDLDIRKEFDRLAANVAKRFGVSVTELTGK